MIIKNSLLFRILRFFSTLKKDGFSWTIVKIFLRTLKQPNENREQKIRC